METIPTITALYAGLLGLVLFGLAVKTILMRRKLKVGLGDGGTAELLQCTRATGNFIEYVPLVLVLMLLLELNGVPALLLHGCGAALVVARLAHALGLLSSAGTSAGRFVGTSATFVLLIGFSVAAIGLGLGLI